MRRRARQFNHDNDDLFHLLVNTEMAERHELMRRAISNNNEKVIQKLEEEMISLIIDNRDFIKLLNFELYPVTAEYFTLLNC